MPDVSLPTSLLHESPLCPALWPFRLDLLPRESYLVGGVVRDVLLGRQADYLDLDFVMPERSVETARAIAQQYNAGFVVLDAERQIARVVFEKATVDFALQEGSSLEQDLKRRDFTINAMAYNPHTQTLVDPLDGYGDLQRRCLRMVSEENLWDDPLRLLRAYRQSAQLGFELEEAIAIQNQAHGLAQVAAERVQSELNTLLATPRGTDWLDRAWAAGLLAAWLPSATAASLEQVRSINLLEGTIAQLWPTLLTLDPSHTKSALGKFGYGALARLVALTASEAEAAEQELQRLKFSRLEVRTAGMVRQLLPQLAAAPLSVREQFFLFQTVGTLFPVLALMGWVSEREAASSPFDTAINGQPDAILETLQNSAIAPLVRHYIDPSDPVAHPKPMLGGRDLMQILDLKPGPHLGKLLTELQVAQAEGEVRSREAAIVWSQTYIQSEEFQQIYQRRR
jgi:tRNA nucleotidyltransferase (CCA-adding enzyme)